MEIDLEKVEDIEEKEYIFDEGSERERRVRRYLYKVDGESNRLIVPKTVHEQIVFLVKKKHAKKVQIYVEGQGIKKKYIVIPTAFKESTSG